LEFAEIAHNTEANLPKFSLNDPSYIYHATAE